jgi:hypothetical protein
MRGEGEPETFDFLGFTHFCTRSRKRGVRGLGQSPEPVVVLQPGKVVLAASSPLRRQNPSEEPGALAAHAGICAGGEE